MFPQGGDYQSDTYQNTPNMSLMFTMNSALFGNGDFLIQAPPSIDSVQSGFPTIPYTPLEAIFYQQQSSNPANAPVNTLSGSNTGQQTINGQYTMNDVDGTSRYSQGYSSSTGAL